MFCIIANDNNMLGAYSAGSLVRNRAKPNEAILDIRYEKHLKLEGPSYAKGTFEKNWGEISGP